MDHTDAIREKRARLNRVAQISVPVRAEIGSKRLSIGDITELNRGSIIQLNQPADEPVEIIIGNRKFAVGHPVKIKDQIGVIVHHVERRSSDDKMG